MRTTLHLFFAMITSSVAGQYWMVRASLPDVGRYGMACFSLNGYGYIVGGSAGGTDLAELWRYDPVSDQWSQFTSIPGARRAATAFTIGNKAYVTCGLQNSTDMFNDLWEYDPTWDTWTSRAPLPADARYGAFAFSVNGAGYVGTGNMGTANGPYLADLFSYDPTTNQWTARASLPDLERYGATAFATNGYGYVFGGRQQDLTNTNELWKYDPVADSWSIATPLPAEPRTYSVTMAAYGMGLISAGSDEGSHSFNTWYFEPAFGYWGSLPDYTGGSGWLGASLSINDHVFAGLGLMGSTEFNDFWELKDFAYPLATGTPHSQTDDLVVYFDPTMSGVHVSTSISMERTQVELVDASGRVMWSRSVILEPAIPLTIPAADINAGVYAVVVSNKGGRSSARVVIAR